MNKKMSGENYNNPEEQKYPLGALYFRQSLEEGNAIEIPSFGGVINPKRKKLHFGYGHKATCGGALEGMVTATTSIGDKK